MQFDKEYKATKQIMLGEATMNPDFLGLASFIDQAFGVKTINIVYDTIDNGKRPRLNICFEFEGEIKIFKDNIGHSYFDSEKQKIIADKFRQIVKEQKLIREKGFFDFLTRPGIEKYKLDHIWVCYSAFEPMAKIEANESVPQDKVAQLRKELNNKDLWEISRGFSGVTFFLYTDRQVKQFEHSAERKLWADKYFDLLQPYNELGYFKRDEFDINLDSKENFDNNYQSNWFYYYK